MTDQINQWRCHSEPLIPVLIKAGRGTDELGTNFPLRAAEVQVSIYAHTYTLWSAAFIKQSKKNQSCTIIQKNKKDHCCICESIFHLFIKRKFVNDMYDYVK